MNAPLRLLTTLALVAMPWARLFAASAALPRSLKARRAEIESLQADNDAWEAQVGPRLNALIEHVPAFMDQHGRVQSVVLTPAERALLAGEGAAALPEDKAAIFRGAGPAAAEMKGRLAAYFEAYDRWERGELRLRLFGSVLACLEKYSRLKRRLSDRVEEKIDREVDRLKKAERAFRRLDVNPKAKNHKVTYAVRDLIDEADRLDDVLEKHCRAQGLSPEIPWGQRVGAFLRRLKTICRVSRNYAVTLPAVAGGLAYMFNPFRKEPDPDRFDAVCRLFSKLYRWSAGLKLEVKGSRNLPSDAPLVLAFSHRAPVEDAMTMMAVTPDRFTFMARLRVLPDFLAPIATREPGLICVDARKADGTTVNAVQAGIDCLKSGRNLAIFPEGTTPTRQAETWPLRSGIDAITQALGAEPCYIVPVSIVDPVRTWERPGNVSDQGKAKLTVTFARPIDPLKFHAVPGADRQLLLDLVRFHWHRDLYRRDVTIDGDTRDLGVLTGDQAERFDRLHQGLH